MTNYKLLILLSFFLFSKQLIADENLDKGKVIAENICSVCHGVNGQANTGGNSVLVPHLTAQNEFYLIEKLKDYKSKKLEHHQMSLIADMLSVDDIKNVSKWYSSIKIEIEDIVDVLFVTEMYTYNLKDIKNLDSQERVKHAKSEILFFCALDNQLLIESRSYDTEKVDDFKYIASKMQENQIEKEVPSFMNHIKLEFERLLNNKGNKTNAT